jgi:hypothetical protein
MSHGGDALRLRNTLKNRFVRRSLKKQRAPKRPLSLSMPFGNRDQSA